MLNFLKELVEQSSETKDVQGVLAVQKIIEKRLSLLGGTLTWLEPEVPHFAPALLASWGTHNNTNDGICFISHADTVYSHKELRPFSINEKEGVVFGGGVADNKGGLVVACLALEKLYSAGILRKSKRPLYFFSSSCEELGSPAFLKFIHGFSLKLSLLLGMEPALPNGNLIKKRRGNRYYTLKSVGNSVHTGRDLVEAANPLSGVVELYKILEELKVKHPRIGISLNGIRSNSFKFNMSPEFIEANLDTRFEKQSDIDSFHKEFTSRLEKVTFISPNNKHTGKIIFEVVDDCPAFDTSHAASNDLEISSICEFYSKHETTTVQMGDGLGASDCCYFYREGLKIVDGLGPRGGKIHSPDEFIEMNSLEARAAALADYLSWLLLK